MALIKRQKKTPKGVFKNNCSKKFCKIPRKTSPVESFVNKEAGFLGYFATFFTISILKEQRL